MIRVLPAFKICFADGGQAITCYASGCIQQAINLFRKLVTNGGKEDGKRENELHTKQGTVLAAV